MDAATPLSHRLRMLEIDVESGFGLSTFVSDEEVKAKNNIVVEASIAGAEHIPPVHITIPVSVDLSHHSPLAVTSSWHFQIFELVYGWHGF